jgi:hypothetical protein
VVTLSVADSHGPVADHQLPAAAHFAHSLPQSAHLLSDGHAPNTHPLQLLVTLAQLLKPLADSKGDEDHSSAMLIILAKLGRRPNSIIRPWSCQFRWNSPTLTVCRTCLSPSLILRRNPATMLPVGERLSDSCFYFIR